jgi:heat shock protein HtpX
VHVQLAGLVSLLVIPTVLALLSVALFAVSVALGLVMLLIFVVAAQVALARHWSSGRQKFVSAAEAPELYGLVGRLCVQSGLRKPRIVVHSVSYANSWVKGLSPRRSTLHLTSGLVELLDESQLEGVIAHELAHIGQKDSPLMSAVGAPVEAMLAAAAFYFHMLVAEARGYKRSLNPLSDRPLDNKDMMFVTFASGWFLPLFLIPVGLAFLVLGELCRIAASWFSRVRELEADAGAAQLTGNPAALASALIALSGSQASIPRTDLRKASTLDIFHIVAMRKEFWPVRTHPSLKRRLAQLDQIGTRLQASHAPA